MYKILALAMATAAAALPSPQSLSSIGATPDKSTEFALAMSVPDASSNTYVSLTAVTNGTIGNKVLKAGRLSVYPGTPAYFNGTGSKRALNFDDTDGIYGAHVQDVGENYGYAASVATVFGYQEFEWSAANGTVYHTLYGALNNFYACEDEAEGEQNLFLKFGVEGDDGQPPAGCNTTRVILNCNIEGGATDCASI